MYPYVCIKKVNIRFIIVAIYIDKLILVEIIADLNKSINYWKMNLRSKI